MGREIPAFFMAEDLLHYVAVYMSLMGMCVWGGMCLRHTAPHTQTHTHSNVHQQILVLMPNKLIAFMFSILIYLADALLVAISSYFNLANKWILCVICCISLLNI